VQDFLWPQRIRSHTNLWLDTGLPSTGWISILSPRDEPMSPRSRAVYLTLRPHLARLLRKSLLAGASHPADPAITAREREVAWLIGEGYTNRMIAARLGVREDTVKKHVSRAMEKLHVKNRTALAVALAARHGD
jgi:DNA-binding NarL/FixJ family response regulator